MSANVPARGPAQVLDGKAEPDRVITEADVQDPATLARYLADHDRDIAAARRPWRPRRIDFEARLVGDDGTTPYRFEHRFASPVRYWVVDWDGAAAPNVRKHATSTADTLVVTSTSEGTMTLRVEESGG